MNTMERDTVDSGKARQKRVEAAAPEKQWDWAGWPPLVVLPLSAGAARSSLPPWGFMWLLAFSVYAGLKWLTWWRARSIPHSRWRTAAYLLAWPGMDADSFLDARDRALPPAKRQWAWAILKTAGGAGLLWMAARWLSDSADLLRGWAGMAGLVLLLHFGSFHLLSLFWQRLGVHARPIMSAPLGSTSLSEFWGRRWNLGFSHLGRHLIIRPLRAGWGENAAGLLVFAVSGLIHDAVISLPAGGGYGLPTMYFLIQGAGVMVERSSLGRRFGLRQNVRGWVFMAALTAGPAFWLFHPLFIRRVILPFMFAVHAL